MAVFDDWSGDRGMLPGSRPSRCPAAVGADVSGVPDPVAGHLHVADYRSEGPRRQGAVLVSIGHGSGLINFNGARFAAHEVTPDKARRVIALR
jgi:hypothetical protein